MTPHDLAAAVKQRARDLGFDAVGIADLRPPPHGAELRRWLDQGMAGTMTYMHRQAARRLEPARIVEGAIRAVMVIRNYYLRDPEPADGTGLVARYARGRDYHEALRGPLEDLASAIRNLGPAGTIARPFMDAGAVPERELAQRAGLGWIGKNTMLINPGRGSFFFIGSVFTSLDLETDLPFEADRCGTCRRCLDACPTSAFAAPRVLDARRCISYLTIEYKGEISNDAARDMGTRIFGCDVCQDVCPWNVSFASNLTGPGLDQAPELALLPLVDLTQITDEDFASRFSDTALSRPGPAGMRRNARIAAANSSRESACPTP